MAWESLQRDILEDFAEQAHRERPHEDMNVNVHRGRRAVSPWPAPPPKAKAKQCHCRECRRRGNLLTDRQRIYIARSIVEFFYGSWRFVTEKPMLEVLDGNGQPAPLCAECGSLVHNGRCINCGVFKTLRGRPWPFYGVTQVGASGLWDAHITFKGQRTLLGSFTSAEAAAERYDDEALKLHGSLAATNYDYGAKVPAPPNERAKQLAKARTTLETAAQMLLDDGIDNRDVCDLIEGLAVKVRAKRARAAR